MKRILSVVAVLVVGLGINLFAQETPSSPQSAPATQTAPSTQTPDNSMQQPVSTTSDQKAAQSFQGTISKSGDKLVLKDSATQASYKLDDQDKARQFEGQSVKVTATMDAATNTLHVVDISPNR
jgi:hypothetical protein